MVEKTVLSNGIRIVTQQIPQAHSVSIGLLIARGSRHETPEQMGLCHLTEHLLFKGNARRSALQLAKQVDALGGPLNGYTGREYSCLHLRFLPEKLVAALDLLLDLLLEGHFTVEQFASEQSVVLQELRQLQADTTEYLHDLCAQNCWQGHALGQPVMGNAASVSRLGFHQVRDFLPHYRAGCQVVSLAGPICHERVVALLRDGLAALPAAATLPQTQPPALQASCQLAPGANSSTSFCLAFPALPQRHPQRFANMLLNAVLGAGMSSRLFQRLREREGWAYNVYSYLNCYADAGALVIHGETAPQHGATALAAVAEEIDQLCRQGIAPDELQVASDQLIGRLRMAQDSCHSRMERLTASEFYHGRFIAPFEVAECLRAVTIDQLQALARFLFDPAQAVLCLGGEVDAVWQRVQDIPLLSQCRQVG
ncbi:MAG: pitrilysin family protein [Desulfuromonas thiophila]|nr:pitrilysin family protein [Desulfuromonas thiophila]